MTDYAMRHLLYLDIHLISRYLTLYFCIGQQQEISKGGDEYILGRGGVKVKRTENIKQERYTRTGVGDSTGHWKDLITTHMKSRDPLSVFNEWPLRNGFTGMMLICQSYVQWSTAQTQGPILFKFSM